MESKAPVRPDLGITLSVFILTAIGLVMIYSTSSILKVDGEVTLTIGYFGRALVFAGFGAIAYYLMSQVPPEVLRKFAYPALILSIVLLLFVWIPPFGFKAKGASRWIKLAGLRFQPSELVKIAVVIFMAHSISKRGEKIKELATGYLPNLLIPAVPICLILLEPDMGTAALLFGIVFVMCFVGGVRGKYLVYTIVPAALAVIPLIALVPYRRARFFAFLDPWEHELESGFQLVHSFLAFGEGGIWGVGLGAGKQKLEYLPEAHTDFILSIWAEEMGLVGVIALLAVGAFLTYRGYQIAMRQADDFSRLLAVGITCWFGLQAALNALVVMGCLPTKGLPFPFVSYGGTGLIVTFAAAGILAGLGGRSQA